MLGMIFNGADWAMRADILVVILLSVAVIVAEIKEAHPGATGKGQ